MAMRAARSTRRLLLSAHCEQTGMHAPGPGFPGPSRRPSAALLSSSSLMAVSSTSDAKGVVCVRLQPLLIPPKCILEGFVLIRPHEFPSGEVVPLLDDGFLFLAQSSSHPSLLLAPGPGATSTLNGVGPASGP